MSDIETTENNKNNFLPGQGSNSQEAAQRLQDIGSSILRAARDELYLGMRFLDVALSSFIYQMDGQSVWNRRGCDVLPSGTAWRAL